MRFSWGDFVMADRTPFPTSDLVGFGDITYMNEDKTKALVELIASLKNRYTAEPVPACPVCGGELGIASIGGGEPTVWACSPQEEDPENPGFLRLKKGRKGVDDHYTRSRWKQYRGGDSEVLDLIAHFEAQSSSATMRAALVPFAKIADLYDEQEDDDHQPLFDTPEVKLTLRQCREARAALNAGGEGDGIKPQDEVAWLFELKGGVPTYWTNEDWTRDVEQAIRFARKQDAELIINDFGWTEAVAVEHMWPSPPTNAHGTGD
jgi:hypothetical protein